MSYGFHARLTHANKTPAFKVNTWCAICKTSSQGAHSFNLVCFSVRRIHAHGPELICLCLIVLYAALLHYVQPNYSQPRHSYSNVLLPQSLFSLLQCIS